MKRIALVCLILLLTSCFTYVNVRNAKDVYADDKTNVVFLGYDISVNHHRVEAIAIEYKNQDGRIRQLNLIDEKDQERYVGAGGFRMDFGDYTITDVVYSVNIGEKKTKTCETSDGEEKCNTTVEALSKTYRLNTDFNISFTVGPNTSPYIGRFFVPFSGVQGRQTVVPSQHIMKLEEDLALVEDKDLRAALMAHLSSTVAADR